MEFRILFALGFLLGIAPPALADVEPVPAPAEEQPVAPKSEGEPSEAEPAPTPAASPQALRDYRARYLRVEPETIQQQGEVWLVTSGHPFWSWPGSHHSTTMVHQKPDRVIQTWGVYQDFMRLDIPAFLSVIGKADEADALRNEIDGLLKKSHRCHWVGVTGVLLSAGSAVVVGATANPIASGVTLVGMLTTAGGFFGGAMHQQRAATLQDNYPASFEPSEIRALVDAYNELLRLDLRLSPSEAMMLESGRRDRSH